MEEVKLSVKNWKNVAANLEINSREIKVMEYAIFDEL
jgi:hypothetical protein